MRRKADIHEYVKRTAYGLLDGSDIYIHRYATMAFCSIHVGFDSPINLILDITGEQIFCPCVDYINARTELLMVPVDRTSEALTVSADNISSMEILCNEADFIRANRNGLPNTVVPWSRLRLLDPAEVLVLWQDKPCITLARIPSHVSLEPRSSENGLLILKLIGYWQELLSYLAGHEVETRKAQIEN